MLTLARFFMLLLTLSTVGRGATLLQNGDFEGATLGTTISDEGFANIFVELPLGWSSDANFRVAGKGWSGQVATIGSTIPGYHAAGESFPFDVAPENHFLLLSSPAGRSQPVGADLAWSTVSLYQEFDTVPGNTYVLGFDVAASSATVASPNAAIGILLSDAQNGLAEIAAGAANWSHSSQGYEFQRAELTFTATGNSTRLTLQDMTQYTAGSPVGAVVDNISVEAIQTIPEPASLGLLAGCLALLGGRRKRK